MFPRPAPAAPFPFSRPAIRDKCRGFKKDGTRCTFNANPVYGYLFCGNHKDDYARLGTPSAGSGGGSSAAAAAAPASYAASSPAPSRVKPQCTALLKSDSTRCQAAASEAQDFEFCVKHAAWVARGGDVFEGYDNLEPLTYDLLREAAFKNKEFLKRLDEGPLRDDLDDASLEDGIVYALTAPGSKKSPRNGCVKIGHTRGEFDTRRKKHVRCYGALSGEYTLSGVKYPELVERLTHALLDDKDGLRTEQQYGVVCLTECKKAGHREWFTYCRRGRPFTLEEAIEAIKCVSEIVSAQWG